LRRVLVASDDVRSENMQQLYFTIRESSRYLRMRTKQFRELVRDGRVKPSMVDDGKRLFSRGDLDSLRPTLPAPLPPPKPPIARPVVCAVDAVVAAAAMVDDLPGTPEIDAADAVTDPMPDAPDEAATSDDLDDPGVDPDSDWAVEVVDFDTFAFRLGSPPAGKEYRLRIRYRRDANTWPVVATVIVDGADLFAPGTWLPDNIDGKFVVAVFPGEDICMTTPLKPRFSVDSRPWWAIPNRYETGRARPAETSYRGTHVYTRARDQVDPHL
jgi:hypothetical protein